MAEGAPLLREYLVKSWIEGSTPSLSAIFRLPVSKLPCLHFPLSLFIACKSLFRIVLCKQIKSGYAGAALAFGIVQGIVCCLEDIFRAGHVVIDLGDANAERAVPAFHAICIKERF